MKQYGKGWSRKEKEIVEGIDVAQAEEEKKVVK